MWIYYYYKYQVITLYVLCTAYGLHGSGCNHIPGTLVHWFSAKSCIYFNVQYVLFMALAVIIFLALLYTGFLLSLVFTMYSMSSSWHWL